MLIKKEKIQLTHGKCVSCFFHFYVLEIIHSDIDYYKFIFTTQYFTVDLFNLSSNDNRLSPSFSYYK
jgi:hypothetical protein